MEFGLICDSGRRALRRHGQSSDVRRGSSVRGSATTGFARPAAVRFLLGEPPTEWSAGGCRMNQRTLRLAANFDLGRCFCDVRCRHGVGFRRWMRQERCDGPRTQEALAEESSTSTCVEVACCGRMLVKEPLRMGTSAKSSSGAAVDPFLRAKLAPPRWGGLRPRTWRA